MLTAGMSVRKHLTQLGPLLGPRRLRLLCCAWYRNECGWNRGFADAIDLAERFADDRAEAHELATMRFARRNLKGPPAWTVCWVPDADPLGRTCRALDWLEGLGESLLQDRIRSAILDDIAGHLHHPPIRIAPAWLAWESGIIGKLARVLYQERHFDQLPVLADALEDAGCAEAGLLAHLRDQHLRDPGRHVRGCWALDLILGRK